MSPLSISTPYAPHFFCPVIPFGFSMVMGHLCICAVMDGLIDILLPRWLFHERSALR